MCSSIKITSCFLPHHSFINRLFYLKLKNTITLLFFAVCEQLFCLKSCRDFQAWITFYKRISGLVDAMENHFLCFVEVLLIVWKHGKMYDKVFIISDFFLCWNSDRLNSFFSNTYDRRQTCVKFSSISARP